MSNQASLDAAVVAAEKALAEAQRTGDAAKINAAQVALDEARAKAQK